MANKLTKKISFNRAKKFKEFVEIEKIYNEIKEKEQKENKKRGVSKTEDLSKLTYYVIVEYYNLSDQIDYDKIFPNDNFIVDFEALLNEQEKIMDHINIKQKHLYPKIFNKLGIINKVTGCYLIATTKGLHSLKTKNTINNLSIKLNNDDLPCEVFSLCDDFYSTEEKNILRNEQEFERFISLSFEEQDIILQNILENISFSDNKITLSENMKIDDEKDDSWILSGKNEVNAILDITVNNIDKINSMEYLNSLLKKFERQENYEICAKLRDRISFLKGKK